MDDSNDFSKSCTALIGQVAANVSLAESIITAIANEKLTKDSGPMAMGAVLKGSPSKHQLSEFLKSWKLSAAHLTALDVSGTLSSALSCYRLALERSHTVDTVWTGPEVSGSKTRRTDAVVREIISEAREELLVVGYWLVTSTIQVKELIELLKQKARNGVKIRFVFDPSEKSHGLDNLVALDGMWASGRPDTPRQVFSWSKAMEKISSRAGVEYDRKLHAKVIVADRHDALVTSANLTLAGLLQNLEMGFRVEGQMATAVVEHFDLLISEGILELRH
jgi:cardiolipin synthase